MSDLNKFLNDFRNLLQSLDDYANKNANMLFLQHGDGLTYKQERIKQYKKATHFIYENYNFKILKVHDDIVYAKCISKKPERSWFSNRRKPRKDWFYIGSNKDKLAHLYKKLENGKNEII
jgi:hypothetical protein